MAHIQDRRDDGKGWVVRYRDPDGRERSKSFPRKTDAERFLHDTESRKQKGTWTDPEHGKVTYRKWVDQWWPGACLHLRDSTRLRDKGLLDNHAVPEFGDWQLASVGQLDVQAWVSKLRAKGLAPSTVKECYRVLSQSFGAAVDAGMLPITPCRNVKLPKQEREEKRFLTPAEVARLADCIRPRFRALVLLAAYSGLRIGELAALRSSDVNLLSGKVTVTRTLNWVQGHMKEGPPKTRNARRTVGLPSHVVEELKQHLTTYPADDDGRIFTMPKGGPFRHTHWRKRYWNPAVKDANLGHVTPHELRHTAVSLWIASGADLKTVATWVGHSSVAFTLDQYGHLFPNHDEDLRARLDVVARKAEEDERAKDADVLPFPEGGSEEAS